MRKVRFLETHEEIPGLSGKNFGRFWQWACSDSLSNGNRSVFAEYIVGVALSAVDQPRREWHRCDLFYEGKEIEVKASGYVQAWLQAKPSLISFDIAKKAGWDAETNTTATEAIRSADCYVFCLHPDKDPTLYEICDVNKWVFYVLPRAKIETFFGDHKSVALSRIQKVVEAVGFGDLKSAVDEALALS